VFAGGGSWRFLGAFGSSSGQGFAFALSLFLD